MLFRRQVLEAKKQTLTGRVVLIQPLSLYGISAALFALFVLILFYLSQFEFARKETVKGYLAPQKGVITLYFARSGVLNQLWVEEGLEITEGQSIARIQNSQGLTNGKERTTALLQEIDTQLKILEKKRTLSDALFNKQTLTLQHQLERLNQSLSAINKAKQTNTIRLDLQAQLYEKRQTLSQDGYISATALIEAKEALLEYQESNQTIDKEVSSLQVEIAQIQTQQQLLPEQHNLKLLEIQQQISLLQAQKVEINSEYEFTQKAPKQGTVTAIQAKVGSQVSPSTPILSIIPTNSPLELELLLPTRSAGFVQQGDTVNIRFDAFPYQKFGLMTGAITSIEKALILPSDKALPIQTEQAMYRVTASLPNQFMNAYGEEFPLKTGMLAEADIILETRTLLEWLLDPVYAIQGKL